jgi:DNA repair protein SbcD/Mre11
MQAPMRLLHTSDWHLGHVLHGMSREREHREFLSWLVRMLVAEQIEVLLVTGDVFDSSTPSATAEAAWFDFLAEARRARPEMDIVVIAGNHDSPSRLSAPSAVLKRLGVHIVGQLPRRAKAEGGGIDFDRMLIPVAGGRGLIAAVPFLRPLDLSAVRLGELAEQASGAEQASEARAAVPQLELLGAPAAPAEVATGAPAPDEPEAFEDGPAAVYREVAAAARARLAADQALIVTGHLYVAGAEPSWLSERRIAVGGQEALPPGLFPDDAQYVALGHLHRAQRVLVEHVRYAGAPIPLAMVEARYRHSVVVVELEGKQPARHRLLEIPRAVELLRVPRVGAAPLPEILAELAMLPALPAGDLRSEADPRRPFLEVVVALSRPEPRLRASVDAALEGKVPRLIRLGTETTGDGASLGDHRRGQQLAELEPTEVFERCWHRKYGDAPSAAIRGAFQRLLDEVRGDRSEGGGEGGGGQELSPV